MERPLFLISTLAIYQTRFWLEVALYLKGKGHQCVFLSFDDRSTELLRAKGLEVYSPRYPLAGNIDDSTFEGALEKYAIDNVNVWLSHERMAFNLYDAGALRAKLVAYLAFVDDVIATVRKRPERALLVQEVGGFVSVVAAFFAARYHGVDNWFIEPSFFRGRMFLAKNTFEAPSPSSTPRPPTDEVQAYLDSTLAAQQIVIPTKDKAHYSAPVNKIVNRANLVRLIEKVADKYVFRRHQEFGHIGSHVGTHLRMALSSWRLRPFYRPVKSLGRFVYYPFHVPADMALTIRAPQYLDQIALVDYLARAVPHGHQLAIKEHPAMVGAIDARRLGTLLKRYDHVALVPPDTNNYEVLTNADLVVSVNSKSGAEALLTQTPVLALGDSFYKASGLVRTAESLDGAATAMRQMLAERPATPDRSRLGAFFQRVWDATYPGELYVASSTNAIQFGDSMLQATGQ